MRPSLLTRIRWWLEDLWEAQRELFTRLGWWLQDLRDAQDARVIVGGLLVLAVLALGGFVAARAIAGGSTAASTRPAVRVVTVRQKVRVRVHGRVVTRWRIRKVYAKAQTVRETETIHTPTGIRVVTHPVTRYRVVYRKHLVRVHGKTRTVLRPVTNTHTLTNTLTNTRTQLVTVSHPVTNTQVVTKTQPVTIVATTTIVTPTTVVSTETATVTVTVTAPTTTGG